MSLNHTNLVNLIIMQKYNQLIMYIIMSKSVQEQQYDSVKDQNAELEKKKIILQDTYSTDHQRVVYQSEESANLDIINRALFYTYFAFFVVVVYIVGFVMQGSIYFRGFLLILFAIYPFVIKYIEYVLFDVLKFASSIFNGNVYTVDKI